METTPLPFATRAGLVVASVALLWLALPPVGVAPLALVALAPFLASLRGLSAREGMRVGLAFGYLSAAANAHWFIHVFPVPMVLVLWAIIGVFGGIYGAFHAGVARSRPALLPVLAPAAWIALDWFRSEVWHLKFAWFTLGHALAGSSILRQNADMAGVYGLTLFAFGTSLTLERIVAFRKDGRALVLAILVLAANGAFAARGNRVLGFAPAPDKEEGPVLRVLAVQDEDPDKLEPKRSLTIAAATSFAPDVILWPEDSFMSTTSLLRAKPALDDMAHLARQAFVVGAMREVQGVKDRFHNCALVIDPRGHETGAYVKRVPVPFVEGMCVPGDASPVFSLATARIGVEICYDGTHPFVTRDLVRAGAEVLLLPTMDLESWGRVQHEHHALFYPLRACEVRRPIVRAASSGVTFALDAWGREIGKIDLFKPGTLEALVHPNDTMTPYALGGFALPWVASVVASLGLVLVLAKR
jgi:apolipoprotein N-acyltransferase